eukprot:m.393447 g.393447  ORF g.393447 m.393447 type:complete len:69 (+) comp252509_c0_seq1:52-258(+)
MQLQQHASEHLLLSEQQSPLNNPLVVFVWSLFCLLGWLFYHVNQLMPALPFSLTHRGPYPCHVTFHFR